MKPFSILLLLLLSFSSTPSSHATSSPNCPASRCTPNGPKIRFPFFSSEPTTQCGYPGFQLSCDKSNKTIVTLPNSGHFIVTRIDYVKQSIYINDPNHCLPNRILNKINLTGSPFQPAYLKKVVFYNCSSWESKDTMLNLAEPIQCLGGKRNNSNYTVIVTDNYYKPFGCTKIMRVSIPVEMLVYRYDAWVDLTEDLMLTWRDPSCGSCEAAGGKCRMKNIGTEEVECFDIPTRLSRYAKYAITIGIGVPGCICLIGFLCYTCTKRQARSPNHQTGRTITPQPAHTIVGLDGPTINSFPKTVLGDSGRLPNPNDGTCSICLAEYLPKEILRSIPECNHYFHASCVDDWLKLNATCPLCRIRHPGC